MSTTVPNFQKVDDKVYRCGQPADEAEWRWLRAQFRDPPNIVKLNEDDGYQGAPDEFCLTLGMQLFKSPISIIEQVLTEPDLQAIIDTLGYMRECNGNVVVHCWRGVDRTGLLCALYRITQGWSQTDALDEWKRLGGDAWELQGLRKAFYDLAPKLSRPADYTSD